VAESTRLILVKDGFGGDLGALDRWTDERRKDTRILEWFGPPERNTLRPLGSCIDCVSLSGKQPKLVCLKAWNLCSCVSKNLPSNEYTLPFIVQGRCLHCAGPRQVGPANRSLLYVIWRSPSAAPRCSLPSWEDSVRIHNLDTVACRPAGTVIAVNVTQQWCCAATVGCDSKKRGGSADPPYRRLCAHCSSARLGSLVTAHHYAARGAMMRLHAAGALYTVTRRAALETGGLTVVSAYLPRVPVAGRSF
jgi:hypothetical protein